MRRGEFSPRKERRKGHKWGKLSSLHHQRCLILPVLLCCRGFPQSAAHHDAGAGEQLQGNTPSRDGAARRHWGWHPAGPSTHLPSKPLETSGSAEDEDARQPSARVMQGWGQPGPGARAASCPHQLPETNPCPTHAAVGRGRGAFSGISLDLSTLCTYLLSPTCE